MMTNIYLMRYEFNNILMNFANKPLLLIFQNNIENGYTKTDGTYNCAFNQCSYSTTRLSHMKRHMVCHSGLKPYNCEYCSFKCADQSNFRRHVRMHTGERPFKCKQCKFQCSDPSSLKRHVRVHTGEKPYHCQKCDYKCAKSQSFKNHMFTAHRQD